MDQMKDKGEEKEKTTDFQDPGTETRQSTEQGAEERQPPSYPAGKEGGIWPRSGFRGSICKPSPSWIENLPGRPFSLTSLLRAHDGLVDGVDYKSTQPRQRGLWPERGGIHRPNGPTDFQDDRQRESVV